jgi:hypothetical protein
MPERSPGPSVKDPEVDEALRDHREGATMTEMTTSDPDDTPSLPDPAAESGQPEEGDNQDVAARRIYPTDPTGADPS